MSKLQLLGEPKIDKNQTKKHRKKKVSTKGRNSGKFKSDGGKKKRWFEENKEAKQFKKEREKEYRFKNYFAIKII